MLLGSEFASAKEKSGGKKDKYPSINKAIGVSAVNCNHASLNWICVKKKNISYHGIDEMTAVTIGNIFLFDILLRRCSRTTSGQLPLF